MRHNTRSPTIRATVSTKCQHWLPQANKFEEVSGLGHQMGLTGKGGGPQVNKFEQVLATRCHYQREGRAGVGSLYGVVQCIMGNGHMDPLWTDRLTDTHD